MTVGPDGSAGDSTAIWFHISPWSGGPFVGSQREWFSLSAANTNRSRSRSCLRLQLRLVLSCECFSFSFWNASHSGPGVVKRQPGGRSRVGLVVLPPHAPRPFFAPPSQRQGQRVVSGQGGGGRENSGKSWEIIRSDYGGIIPADNSSQAWGAIPRGRTGLFCTR